MFSKVHLQRRRNYFTSSRTSTFRCLGPGATGRALCRCITEKCVWRQAFVSPRDAVISGVPSDPGVVNNHPKLWDRRKTTGHSCDRRDTMSEFRYVSLYEIVKCLT